jgi:hypothetical protein
VDFRPTRLRTSNRTRAALALALLLACFVSAQRAYAQTEAPAEAAPPEAFALASAPLSNMPPHTLQRDMSVFGMFMDAGAVAKSVMILLDAPIELTDTFIRDPQPVFGPHPEYPERALRFRREGGFDRAAKKALAKWRYDPQLVNAVPSERSGVRVRIVFKLDQT